MFRTLLYVDVLRGPHSTGVGIYHEPYQPANAPGEIRVIKEALPAWDFLAYNPDFHKYINNCHAEARLLIGHNRWKTVGEIKDANAHPFRHGNLVGAQNGTLTNFHGVENSTLFDVDSDWAIWRMSEIGIKEAIAEMQGAWAFTVFNSDEKKLYITRNKERPIFFAYTKDRKGLFWASQKNMLVFAADEHNVAFDTSDPKNPGGIWTLDAEDMAIFDLPPRHGVIKNCDVVRAPGAKKVIAPFVHRHPWQEWSWEEEKKEKQLNLLVKRDNNVVDLQSVKESIEATFGKPGTDSTNSTTTPSKWKEITKDGCATCGGPVRKEGIHKVVNGGKQVLCMHCCEKEDKNPFWGMLPKEFEEQELVAYPEVTRRLAMFRVKEMFDNETTPIDKRSIN